MCIYILVFIEISYIANIHWNGDMQFIFYSVNKLCNCQYQIGPATSCLNSSLDVLYGSLNFPLLKDLSTLITSSGVQGSDLCRDVETFLVYFFFLFFNAL